MKTLELGPQVHESLFMALWKSQPVVEITPDGWLQDANDQFLELIGYTREELRGQALADILLKGEVQHLAASSILHMLREARPQSAEFRCTARDGRPVWLHANFVPVMGEDEQVRYVVGLVNDVSPARLSNADHKSLQIAIDRAHALVHLSFDGLVLDANALALDVFGCAPDEMKGRRHEAFFTRDYADSPEYHGIWQQLRAGQPQQGMFQMLSAQGRPLWIYAIYCPRFDAAMRPHSITMFLADVTERRQRSVEFETMYKAINRSQALVEFDMQGRVLTANENFLGLMGYTQDEIEGQHHRMFCLPDYAHSAGYLNFWDRLRRGELEAGEFHRIGKGGRDVWIQASYNPVLGGDGRPVKIVKFAYDVTRQKLTNAEAVSKTEAIARSQAVIEFDMQGNILSANTNFLRAMGYTLEEIVGKHHSMFCALDYVQSSEYRNFWADLNAGRYASGRFKRQAKHGAPIWIEATYNPIFDVHGKPVKVIKFAMDVTAVVLRRQQMQEKTAAISADLGELSTSIRSIEQSSERTADIASQTLKSANQGAQVLTRSREAISAIQRSSADIHEIINTIGDIASQTHLLAFNAAIEAARAGEHGLGFSVVADEVRKLAEKSATAAREIARLVGETVSRVDEGGRLSEDVEQTFAQILEAVQDTSSAVAAIHNSTREQAAATNRVSSLLSQLDSDAAAGAQQ